MLQTQSPELSAGLVGVMQKLSKHPHRSDMSSLSF